MKLKILIVFWFMSLGLSAQEYHTVKSLKNQLLIHDSTYNAFVPLLDITSSVTTFSYILTPAQFKNQYLYFKANSGTAIFINNQLLQRFSATTHRYLNINQLINNSLKKEVVITFNIPSANNLELIESLKIVGKNTSVNSFEVNLPTFTEDRTTKLKHNSVLLICLIVFFIFFAIQRNVSKRLYESIYNLNYIISDIKVEEMLTLSSIDRYKFLLLIFNSLTIAFIIFVFTSPYQSVDSYGGVTVWYILKAALSILIFFLLKYIYIIIISNIFKIGKWSNIQFFEFIKLTMNFALYLLLIYTFFYSPFTFFNSSNTHIFKISTAILIFIFLTRIGFTVKKITGFRSFYLISYLCIAEIVPITIFYTIYFK